MNLECQQILAGLSDYLDGDLAPTQTAAMDEHFRQCRHCAAALASTRQMLQWLGDPNHFALPEGASQRLHEGIEQGLGEPLLPSQLRPAAVAPPPAAARPRRSLQGFGAWSGRLRATAWAAAVVLVLLAVSVARWRTGVVTASGWLIDQHCFAAYQNNVASHPRDCLLRCADKIYGLVDAKGHFTPFDAKGNRTALAAVQDTTKADHLWVTVHAKMSSANVLEVQDLALTEPSEAAATNAR